MGFKGLKQFLTTYCSNAQKKLSFMFDLYGKDPLYFKVLVFFNEINAQIFGVLRLKMLSREGEFGLLELDHLLVFSLSSCC
jgi:hypothetical protein